MAESARSVGNTSRGGPRFSTTGWTAPAPFQNCEPRRSARAQRPRWKPAARGSGPALGLGEHSSFGNLRLPRSKMELITPLLCLTRPLQAPTSQLPKGFGNTSGWGCLRARPLKRVSGTSGPVVKTLRFQCRERWFDPWSGN